MNYDPINTLLEKYWMCATSIEEERQLRYFFTKEFVPPELQPFKAWFCTYEAENIAPLTDDFDKRILARVEFEKKYRRKRVFRISLLSLLLLLLLCCVYYFAIMI